MASKHQKPKITYRQAGEDEAAVNAVFDMLFEKVVEHKAIEEQAKKVTKIRRSPGNETSP